MNKIRHVYVSSIECVLERLWFLSISMISRRTTLKRKYTQKDQEAAAAATATAISQQQRSSRQQNNEEIAELRTFSMSRPALHSLSCHHSTKFKWLLRAQHNCVVNEIFMHNTKKMEEGSKQRQEKQRGPHRPVWESAAAAAAQETNKYLELRWCTTRYHFVIFAVCRPYRQSTASLCSACVCVWGRLPFQPFISGQKAYSFRGSKKNKKTKRKFLWYLL